MQYSISPIIESWLSGILFLVTSLLCFFRIFWGTIPPESLFNIDSDWIPFIVFLFCSFAYAIGWAVNHLAEQILDNLFQHQYRKKLEEENNVSYIIVRSYVFQNCSDQYLNDIKYDRQRIRIARANCFNFFLMAVVIASYLWIEAIPYAAVLFLSIYSMAISVLSFFQWTSRYKATYKKFYQAYSALPEEKRQNNPLVL